VKKPVSVANLEGKIVLGVLTLALTGAIVGITLWLVDEQNSHAEAAVVETGAQTETAVAATTGATTEAETGATTGTETAATTEAETTATTEATTEAETEAETGAGGGDAAAGAEVFASAGCSACHTLAAAGASGTVGPNLDELKPDEATVVEFVTNGRGAMPSFSGQLSEQQIADVAAYVSSSAGT